MKRTSSPGKNECFILHRWSDWTLLLSVFHYDSHRPDKCIFEVSKSRICRQCGRMDYEIVVGNIKHIQIDGLGD